MVGPLREVSVMNLYCQTAALETCRPGPAGIAVGMRPQTLYESHHKDQQLHLGQKRMRDD